MYTWTMKSLKEVTGQIVSVVWHYCQRFLSVVGEKFFNDYLGIDTKRFLISVKWNSYMLYDVHFAADWMNKFPNRGRGYQITNIISWQNSLYCSQLSTSSVIFNNFNSEHRKMRAKQQHVCKEMNQYTCNTNRKWFLSFSIEWTIGANDRK